MTKILAPFSSEVGILSGATCHPEGVLRRPKDLPEILRSAPSSLRMTPTEHLASSIVYPLTRNDEYVVEGCVTHEVHICVEEGARCSMGSVYRAHEKDTDVSVRFFITLEKNATLSLDIASFLFGERSKSDVRVFLVLNEGSRATVRQLTHAEGSSHTVHEEIRGLAVGEYAHASFIPELELLHDDILATHAASIVRIDEKRIAYLLARGVSREDAVGCLAEAFLGVGRGV